MYQEIWIKGTKVREGARSRKRLPLIEFKNFGGRSVLDVGCAEGMLAIESKKAGARRVVALELNDVIEVAKDNAQKEEVEIEFIKTEAGEWLKNCNEHFDYVFFCAMLNHIKDKVQVLHDLSRITDRILYFETNFENNPDVVMEFVKKHTGFKKYNLKGKTGDRKEEDYHLYALRQDGMDAERFKHIAHLPVQEMNLNELFLIPAKPLLPNELEVVRQLKENLAVNGQFRPLWVAKRDNGYWVREGGHRFLAMKELNWEKCKVIDITGYEIRIYSGGKS